MGGEDDRGINRGELEGYFVRPIRVGEVRTRSEGRGEGGLRWWN